MASAAAGGGRGDKIDGEPDSETVMGGDVAKRLYLALEAKDLAAAVRCVAEASDDDLQVWSAWEQRQNKLRMLGAKAPFATRGLTAVHVLARDCNDAELAQQVVTRTPQLWCVCCWRPEEPSSRRRGIGMAHCRYI